MSSERTAKCPVCGEPYKVYSHMAGDQSACPQCREKAAWKQRDAHTPQWIKDYSRRGVQ